MAIFLTKNFAVTIYLLMRQLECCAHLHHADAATAFVALVSVSEPNASTKVSN